MNNKEIYMINSRKNITFRSNKSRAPNYLTINTFFNIFQCCNTKRLGFNVTCSKHQLLSHVNCLRFTEIISAWL